MKVKIRVEKSDDYVDILEAFPEEDPDFVLGAVTVGQERVYDAKHMSVIEGPVVIGIGVDQGSRRSGVGTALWTAAAELACSKWKKPLMSGTSRSRQAEAFWKKQVAKGRAKCIVRAGRKCRVYRLDSCAGEVDLSGLRRRRERK